jgi:hypothetical protein
MPGIDRTAHGRKFAARFLLVSCPRNNMNFAGSSAAADFFKARTKTHILRIRVERVWRPCDVGEASSLCTLGKKQSGDASPSVPDMGLN